MDQLTHSNPPLNSMVCFSVYAAGLAFNRLYRGLLERFNLTYPQFLVLVALQQRGPLNVGQLGEALFLETNTLTPLLQRMQKLGLITRQRSAKDERVVHIALSEKGAKLNIELGCVPPQVLDATHLPMTEISALTQKLNTLAEALREHTQPNQRTL